MTSPRYRRRQRTRQQKLDRDGQIVERRRLVAEVSASPLHEQKRRERLGEDGANHCVGCVLSDGYKHADGPGNRGE